MPYSQDNNNSIEAGGGVGGSGGGGENDSSARNGAAPVDNQDPKYLLIQAMQKGFSKLLDKRGDIAPGFIGHKLLAHRSKKIGAFDFIQKAVDADMTNSGATEIIPATKKRSSNRAKKAARVKAQAATTGSISDTRELTASNAEHRTKKPRNAQAWCMLNFKCTGRKNLKRVH
jgi:uncharacterized protein YaiL (DUF2058 family)